ncbi:hypothetical protein NEFER03_1920 [Nematocida sp. LUAm3]|nr:hypothetical protein NEFER03_1920 [Nematocida sp. LUAm3]KAI5176178.1 hypothetical protein NEFER02_1992 [Nematocida sp. LUAm2]KAI5179272.1 hypothetical protein NEFER01_2124 [Nematocida sp. LUAm1]
MKKEIYTILAIGASIASVQCSFMPHSMRERMDVRKKKALDTKIQERIEEDNWDEVYSILCNPSFSQDQQNQKLRAILNDNWNATKDKLEQEKKEKAEKKLNVAQCFGIGAKKSESDEQYVSAPQDASLAQAENEGEEQYAVPQKHAPSHKRYYVQIEKPASSNEKCYFLTGEPALFDADHYATLEPSALSNGADTTRDLSHDGHYAALEPSALSNGADTTRDLSHDAEEETAQPKSKRTIKQRIASYISKRKIAKKDDKSIPQELSEQNIPSTSEEILEQDVTNTSQELSEEILEQDDKETVYMPPYSKSTTKRTGILNAVKSRVSAMPSIASTASSAKEKLSNMFKREPKISEESPISDPSALNRNERESVETQTGREDLFDENSIQLTYSPITEESPSVTIPISDVPKVFSFEKKVHPTQESASSSPVDAMLVIETFVDDGILTSSPVDEAIPLKAFAIPSPVDETLAVEESPVAKYVENSSTVTHVADIHPEPSFAVVEAPVESPMPKTFIVTPVAEESLAINPMTPNQELSSPSSLISSTSTSRTPSTYYSAQDNMSERSQEFYSIKSHDSEQLLLKRPSTLNLFPNSYDGPIPPTINPMETSDDDTNLKTPIQPEPKEIHL